jgi:hypothetical protein
MAARLMGYVSASNTPTIIAPTAYGVATGGIGAPTAVNISGVDYEYLTFNATGTLTVTTAGFLITCAIGGGGGALSGLADPGGGGGAGQVVFGSIYLSADQTITIGGGGAFFVYTTIFSQAGNTSIAATSPFTQTALGNFVGSRNNTTVCTSFVGGGCGNGVGAQLAFTGNDALGQKGGNANYPTAGGGGGGNGPSSGVGGNGSGTTGGAGGAGFDVAVFIGGSTLYKAQGGGGGGTSTGGAAATDGVAGSATSTPPNGGANTGQGGGGGKSTPTTGNGGSGICYIRWVV